MMFGTMLFAMLTRNAVADSVAYVGCYENRGDVRVHSHEGRGMSFDECRALALARGATYFGLECPECVQEPGLTQCLTMDEAAQFKQMLERSDGDCEVEWSHHGKRLGGAHSLAVYSTETRKVGQDCGLCFNPPSYHCGYCEDGLECKCVGACDEETHRPPTCVAPAQRLCYTNMDKATKKSVCDDDFKLSANRIPYADCELKCENDAECTHFAYSEDGVCRTFHGCDSLKETEKRWEIYRQGPCGDMCWTEVDEAEPKQVCDEEQKLSANRIPYAECVHKCENDHECTHFAYAEDGVCRTFAGCVSFKETEKAWAIYVQEPCKDKQDEATCFEENVDYHGNDIAGAMWVPNVEACQKRCAENSECKFFTYNRDDHQCYIKSSKAGWEIEAPFTSGPASCYEDADYESWDCNKCNQTPGYQYCSWEGQFHSDGGCLPEVEDAFHVPCGHEDGDVLVNECASSCTSTERKNAVYSRGGHPTDWPSFNTEEQCKESCEDSEDCVLYTYHHGNHPSGEWAKKCVTYSNAEVERKDLKMASSSWTDELFVTSGTCHVSDELRRRALVRRLGAASTKNDLRRIGAKNEN